ncbi:MAG: ATP-binding protein [Burkholderiaceae bacterium]
MHGTPRRILLCAVFLVLVGCIGAVWFALSQPSMGVRFAVIPGAPDKEPASLRIMGSPAGGPPAGAIAVRLQGRTDALDLEVSDLTEEPDFFDTYAEMEGFFSRQTRLHNMLQEPEVTLTWQATAASPVLASPLRVLPSRSPAALPAVFWFQLFAASACLMIGAWVFALRPGAWAPRMLAVCGLTFAVCVYAAACYSTRELAIEGTVFRWLSSLNHFGTLYFGSGLIGIFLMHPAQLVRPRWLLVAPAIITPWLAADVWRWAPDQDWGSRIPILIMMLTAIGLAVVQWRRSKGQPAERAALRWLTLSALVGCGLFVLSIVLVNVLRFVQPLEQGYAFGFFLVMFFGLALGVGRYRLFDLDEWAYRVLLWALGVAMVVLVDALLVLWLRWNATLSLGATLLLCGALYFPARQWLWAQLVERRGASVDRMLPELILIAFSASPGERDKRWAQALERLYNPLQSMPDEGAPVTRAAIAEDGLTLRIPATGGALARVLRYRDHGKRLFSGRDAEFTQSLCELMEQAASGRDAHERGVREERLRVARDMHDDIGAKLLTLLHIEDPAKQKPLLREAMNQMRAIVRGMSGKAQPFSDFVADLRHTFAERTQAAGVELEWNDQLAEDFPLEARQQYQLRNALNEVLSNALRHASPKQIGVGWRLGETGALEVSISDDGKGMPATTGGSGLGLDSVRTRLQEARGQAVWEPLERGGTVVRLTVSPAAG